MYEVCKHFERKGDLDHFLRTTRNFGKRFYVVQGNSQKVEDEEWLTISVTAIAVSRDLTYIFKMNMRCEVHTNDPNHDKVMAGELPLFGWVPRDEAIRKLYFPCIPHYCDVFKYNGFHDVGSIRKDGVDLTL